MKNDNNIGCGCLIYLVVFIVVIAICLGYVYLVASSNLPDWMKFWLLK